jgi:hypothetical protein
VDVKTLRRWKKTRPNLYKIIMLGFAFEEAVKRSKENYKALEKLEREVVDW